MGDRIYLNLILSSDSTPRRMQLWKYDTVRSIKLQIRRSISCQSDWTPQQLHYTLRLYNQHYQELPDSDTLVALERGGVIWNEDDIYMIISVDSGRVIDAMDRVMRYLRSLCIGIRPMAVREEPNHNYMFTWCSSTERYSPPSSSDSNTPIEVIASPRVAPIATPPQTMSQLLTDNSEPPTLASSYLEEHSEPYRSVLSAPRIIQN